MNILKRLEKLERMGGKSNGKRDVSVFIVPCPTDEPIRCANYDGIKIYRRDDETLDEFESRCVTEVRHLPSPTGVRVFNLCAG